MSDRELDAKVAKAMGVPVKRRHIFMSPSEGDEHDRRGACTERCWIYGETTAPNYCNSADGLLAMLRFHADAGWEVTVQFIEGAWWAGVGSTTTSGMAGWRATGSTPGEALARATVKACAEKVA